MSGPEATEVELTKELVLHSDEASLLDMHSFLNLLNVLLGEFYLMNMESSGGKWFGETLDLAEHLKALLSDQSKHSLLAQAVSTLNETFETELRRSSESNPDQCSSPEMVESVSNIRSAFRVMRVRADEFITRLAQPDAWRAYPIQQLRDGFCNFLAAIERNSKGRFHIVFNIAAQEKRDYVVHLSIDSVEGETLTIPPVLQDVFRDLIANARKYTPPGGSITAGLRDDGKRISLVVQDNGQGIPEDEIEKVVEFGYRASNARERRTQGGGFGLTKAYAATRRFNGKMWIKSKLGVGTKITIHISHP